MIDELRSLLDDGTVHLFLGQIKRLHLADDNSDLKVEVSVWPEKRSIICEMTWDQVGAESGLFAFPSIGDAVLCCSAEGDVDESYVIKRLTSKSDKIPNTALSGDSVFKALSGKKLWNTSDTRINLSKGDTEPIENLVCGQKFKTTYANHMLKLIDLVDKLTTQRATDKVHSHLVIGIPTSAPLTSATMETERAALATLKSDIQDLKTDDVDSESFLSDLAFTQKGDE